MNDQPLQAALLSTDTLGWLTNGADALTLATGLLYLWFRHRAGAGRPPAGRERPSWGGEITPPRRSEGQSGGAGERDLQAALWLKFLGVSVVLALVANIVGRFGS